MQDWLLGGLANAGLHLPARLDLAGVIDLLLQVFKLTKTALLGRLRTRLAAVLGPENLGRVEELIARVGGVAVTLWQHGPSAAWPAIAQQAGDLKDQALAFVKDQVLGMAARAVPVFLATLAVPGGAFVQVARGLYNGVMTFVEKGKQIAQVGTALLDSASAMAAGQVAPAAQAVETTLVKILPVALSFLARWLGLGGISGAIQTGLKKVQAPVEKAVGKVLDAITEKAKAVWGAVKGGAGKVVDKGKEVATAVGNKVAGWLGLRAFFETDSGEKHSLYLREKDDQVQIIVESTPTEIEDFLTQYEARIHSFETNASSSQGRTAKRKHLTNIRTLLSQYPSQAEYQRMSRRGTAKVAQQFQADLLSKNLKLSNYLRLLLSSKDDNLATEATGIASNLLLYRFEGLTGTYAQMVGVVGDPFTPDHQPNSATLKVAYNLTIAGLAGSTTRRRLFDTGNEFYKRVKGSHSDKSYAINLHDVRHKRGRTWGSAGGQVATDFEDRVIPLLQSESDILRGRAIVVRALRTELLKDVRAMRTVVADKQNSWNDLALLPPATQKDIQQRVTANILQGEREMLNQPLDDLLK